MNLKKILFISIIYLLGVSNLYSIEPDVFVQSTVNRASQTLSKNISKNEKNIYFNSIFINFSYKF